MASKMHSPGVRLEASMLPPESEYKKNREEYNKYMKKPETQTKSQATPSTSGGSGGTGGAGSGSGDDCSSFGSGTSSNQKASNQLNQNDQPPSRQVSDQPTINTEPGQFASIFNNGPAVSAGSVDHPRSCEPCVHYCFSKRRGCNRGDACTFCHGFHESKLQQKRQRWKGNKRPQPQHKDIPPAQMAPNEQGEVLKTLATEPKLIPKLAWGQAIPVADALVPRVAYSLGMQPTNPYEPARIDVPPMPILPESPMALIPAGPQLFSPTPPGLGMQPRFSGQGFFRESM